jgi:hypothetical protein
MQTDKLILQCKKEAKKQITLHTREKKRWQDIMQQLHRKQGNPDVMNDFDYLYFSDELLAQDRTKRAGFWLRSQEAIKLMNELEHYHGIAGLLPRKNTRQEPLMFAGLYIHYARWLGVEEENTAKLQVWKVLEQYCLDLECGQLTFGDIATIMGIIY